MNCHKIFSLKQLLRFLSLKPVHIVKKAKYIIFLYCCFFVLLPFSTHPMWSQNFHLLKFGIRGFIDLKNVIPIREVDVPSPAPPLSLNTFGWKMRHHFLQISCSLEQTLNLLSHKALLFPMHTSSPNPQKKGFPNISPAAGYFSLWRHWKPLKNRLNR